ncbi:MAG: anti-sigma factor [bacterium]
MKICKWFEEKIFDYVDGILPSEKRKEVEKHFKECSPCLDFFNDTKNIRVQLRNLTSLKTSPDFETVLRTRIRMERSLNRHSVLNGPIRIPIYAVTGAFITIAAFFVFSSLNHGSAKNSNIVAPSYLTNQNVSNYSGTNIQNLSEKVNYPMDWVNLSGGGTAINSDELEKYSPARSDSAKERTPKEVLHSFEF